MSRPEYGTLGDLSVDGSGPALRLGHLEEIVVGMSGDYDGTLFIEVRFDSSQPFITELAGGGSGKVVINYPIFEIRARLLNNTTGTAYVRYAGRDHDRAG